jgi:type II secretory pathway component PulF
MATEQLWRWRALSQQGERLEGALLAPDRAGAWQQLQSKGLFPLELRRSMLHQTRWQPQKRYEVIHQLATLLQAGLTLSAGLELLAQQHPDKHWQALLQSVAEDLSAGSAFSDTLKKWPAAFPPLYLSMIKTGELTGKLDECCRQLAIQQKAQQQLSAKVKKALRYPIIILSLAVAVVLAMVTLVLPEFAAIYKTFNTPLPALTQQAGIAFLQGLESTEETMECPFWRDKIRDIHQCVMQGSPIWSALSHAVVFTPLCIQLVRTGEASGSLDTMLKNLAHHHNEQTFQHADDLASLLEPLLLIVTGVIIGTLVVAMYLPIFHLGDAMSGG